MKVCPSTVVLLSLFAVTVLPAVVEAWFGSGLLRRRREWIIPPTKLEENKDHTKKDYIAKIRSDNENLAGDVEYSLTGVGADKYPFNLFVVDPVTGWVTVTGILDREVISQYNLSGIARYRDGRPAEKDIDLRIKVVDENDNAPVFSVIQHQTVPELSAKDTFIMQLQATDADEPGNDNSIIAYSIVDQQPPGGEDMFYVTKDGKLYVRKPTLDRELHDTYTLTMQGADLNGRPGGHTGRGSVTIHISDVNDNLPTLEKEQYEGSIVENTQGVEVMRLKAVDLDQVGTDNWTPVYMILKGNEAGYFSITTDPVTHEGVLMLDKAVDYEDVKDLELGLAVKNVAAAYGGGGVVFGPDGTVLTDGGNTITYKNYPIKISVQNEPEGPRFDPKVKAIPISEGGVVDTNQVITTYQALDGDTGKPATNVRYAKGSDPDNWLTIDPKTAEIKLNKNPDRESPFLTNGTYYAKILCMTEDVPSQTATGTIAIQVQDFNDHCPSLTSGLHTMCADADAVTVSATDQDAFPNGAPFSFTVMEEGTKGKWTTEHLNDSSAILRAQQSMWPGSYEVMVEVMDQQGLGCPEPQRLTVEVCTCDAGGTCSMRGAHGKADKGAELGAAAIGLMLLGALLLLLVPLLLLFCYCGGPGGLPGGFTEMPFDTKSHLIAYHTEGQGENTEVPLVQIVQTDAVQSQSTMGGMGGMGGMQQTVNMSEVQNCMADAYNNGYMVDYGMQQSTGMGMGMANGMGMGMANGMGMGMANGMGMGMGSHDRWQGGQSGVYSEWSGEARGVYEGIALPDFYLRQYYDQKSSMAADGAAAKDSLLMYDYEGQGSLAGSVGCHSFMEADDDLRFLDDLGPKFKTLAEVCNSGGGGVKMQSRTNEVRRNVSFPDLLDRDAVSSATTAASVATASSSVGSSSQPDLSRPTAPQQQHSTFTQQRTERTLLSDYADGFAHASTTMKKQEVNLAPPSGQTLLLHQHQQQQPVYYAVQQPMHYIVQPQMQLQNQTILLAEAPPNATANMQGMFLVNGPAPTVLGQQQQGGVVYLDSSGGQVPMQVIHQGATLQRGGTLSGSQGVLIMEGHPQQGGVGGVSQLIQEAGGGATLQQQRSAAGGSSSSHRVTMTTSSFSAGSQGLGGGGGPAAASAGFSASSLGGPAPLPVPSPRKVVVQEKRVVRQQEFTE